MTRAIRREYFEVAHIGFEIIDCPKNGRAFKLVCAEELPERRKALFTGFIQPGMSSQLHRLAAHVSTLEERIKEEQREAKE